MKNYKKILSFTLALIMALSVSAVSITAGAAGSASGTEVLNENFETGSPAAGTSISGWNNWEQDDDSTASSTFNSSNTIALDGTNRVASIKRTATTASDLGSYFFKKPVAFHSDTELISIKFKTRRLDQVAAGLIVRLYGPNADNNGMLESDTYFYMNAGNGYLWWKNSVGASTYRYALSGANAIGAVNTWYDVEIKVDYANEKIEAYVEDTYAGYAPLKSEFSNIYGLPTAISFGTQRANTYWGGYYDKNNTQNAEFQLDDILVTGYTAEDIAAMAGQEVAAALAKLSDVTAITTAENLTLPTASDLGTTATVTWTSDTPAVLANDGTVTKAAVAQSAKLTATITSGSVTDTKVFDVTVLPANVYFYEGFNSVTTHSGDNLKGYNNWTANSDPDPDTHGVFTVQKDNNGNYYGSLHRKTSNSNSVMWKLNKEVSAQPTEENGGQSFSFSLKRDANSKNISAVLYGPKIGSSDITMEIKTDYHAVTIGSSYYYPEAIKNDRLNFELIYKNGGVVVYVNGAPLTNRDGTVMSPIEATWNPVTKIEFYTSRVAAATGENVPTTFMLDDVCIKTLSADYVSCISAMESLTFSNPVVDNLDITDEVNDTIITLNSSNTSVVANDGKVTRPDIEEYTPVTLIVTIAKGSESITKTYNVEVAPKYLTIITDTYVDENSKLGRIYITNFVAHEKAVAFAAVYTKNSEGAYVLKGVQMADDITNIKAKGSQNIGFAENKLTVDAGDEIRVFFWNDTNSLTPIAKSYTYAYGVQAAE